MGESLSLDVSPVNNSDSFLVGNVIVICFEFIFLENCYSLYPERERERLVGCIVVLRPR